MTGNAALLAAAIDQADAVIAATPAASAHAPTPCTDWDVSQLIQHAAMIADRVAAAIAPGGQQASSATWAQAYARLRPLLGAVPAGQVVDLPFGRMPLDAALGVYVGEFVTHSWDLAAAVSRADLLSDDLGARALAMVTARIPRSPRAPTPFGEVVPVPDDAPVYHRLAGWMGRNPAR